MERLEIKIGDMHMSVCGNEQLIERERDMFLDFVDESNRTTGYVCNNQMSNYEYELQPCDTNTSNCFLKSPCCMLVKPMTVEYRSWHDIAAAIKDGMFTNIGTIIACKLTDGTTCKFVITDTTNEYVRFETLDFIGDGVAYLNQTSILEKSYSQSSLRNYIDTEILNLLPMDLQDVISTTTRNELLKDGRKSTYATKLFIPTASEVFGETHVFGDDGLYEQLDYYKSYKHRIKEDKSGLRAWWLASISKRESHSICYVKHDGYAGDVHDCSKHKVSICFEISRL